MKTSILTSLFFKIALNAFSQNTNTTGIGPTANNPAIPTIAMLLFFLKFHAQ